MADLSTIRPSWGEGNIKLASPITVGANAALDDRLVVDTYDSLYAAGTFTSIYPGMAVATKDTGDIYVYVGPKALEGSQTASNWKKVGDNSTVSADLTQVKKDIAANTAAISKEVADRKQAITDEVTARNTAITTAIEGLDSEKESSNSSGGTKVKVTQTDGKITGVTVTQSKGEIVADSPLLVDGGTVKAYVDKAVTSTYKVKGSVDEYSKLPTNAVEGDVYNVKAAFTLDFDKKPYPAGTNVVWVAATGSGDAAVAAHWDALGGTIDLSGYKEKQDVVTVAGLSKANTITALSQDANGKITATAAAIAINESQVIGLEDRLNSIDNDLGLVSAGLEARLPVTAAINGVEFSNAEGAYNAVVGANKITMTGYGTASGDVFASDTVSVAVAKVVNAVGIVKNTADAAKTAAANNLASINSLDEKVIKKGESNDIDTRTEINVNIGSFDIITNAGMASFAKDDGFVLTDNSITFKRSNGEKSASIAAREDKIMLSNSADNTGVVLSGVKMPEALEDTTAVNVGFLNDSLEAIGETIDTVKSELIGNDTTANTIKHAEKVAADALAKANEATSKAGVTSFGGKAGAINVDTDNATNGNVKFTMHEGIDTGNTLMGTVVGLGSAAYTESTAYATAAQGTRADNAVILGEENFTGDACTTFVTPGTPTDPVLSIVHADDSQAIRLSSSDINIYSGSKISTKIESGHIVMTDRNGTQNVIDCTLGGFDFSAITEEGETTSLILNGVATPTRDVHAANKKYVDDQVTSALTWEVI